jgi:hypothetical protein
MGRRGIYAEMFTTQAQAYAVPAGGRSATAVVAESRKVI